MAASLSDAAAKRLQEIRDLLARESQAVVGKVPSQVKGVDVVFDSAADRPPLSGPR